jgi:hypothetical protein
MGGRAGSPRGNPGLGSNNAFMGLASPQQLKMQPLQRTQPIQPLQPAHPMPAGGGFVSGNQRTMNVPGAPKLPNNPYADAAWRQQMYGPTGRTR